MKPGTLLTTSVLKEVSPRAWFIFGPTFRKNTESLVSFDGYWNAGNKRTLMKGYI